MNKRQCLQGAKFPHDQLSQKSRSCCRIKPGVKKDVLLFILIKRTFIYVKAISHLVSFYHALSEMGSITSARGRDSCIWGMGCTISWESTVSLEVLTLCILNHLLQACDYGVFWRHFLLTTLGAPAGSSLWP